MSIKNIKELNFEIPDQDDKLINLSDFKNKYIVLYFYPKDNTPGCTMEAKDFRDNIEEFNKLNTIVLGVSKDTVKKHQGFICKYDLPFSLLADTDGMLCEKFGVFVEKSMFGKKYMGIERSTFIIDPNGNIAVSWHKVKVKNHVSDVIKALLELQQ